MVLAISRTYSSGDSRVNFDLLAKALNYLSRSF
jgi:hypothetical protein